MVFSRKVSNDQAAIEALLDRASAAAEDVRWAID
ncbi:IS110 family transposase, partial [Pseudonocardia sp. EV170527-09]